MRHRTTNGPGKWRHAQRGQAMIEYLLLGRIEDK